jgi:hypothetical protein
MGNSGQSLAPSISLILRKISDDKALTLFNSIAVANDVDKRIQLKQMNLTTKQYYSRISGLVNAGLIKRLKGRYSLTALGKVVYHSHMMIGKTLSYYWKLRAIESLEPEDSTDPSGFSSEEKKQVIATLIDDNQVKDILMNSVSSSIPSPSPSISSID